MDMEAEQYSIQYSIHNNNNQGMWSEDSNSPKCRQANRRPPAILNNILSDMDIRIHTLQWHLHIHIPHIVHRANSTQHPSRPKQPPIPICKGHQGEEEEDHNKEEEQVHLEWEDNNNMEEDRDLWKYRRVEMDLYRSISSRMRQDGR
ncbi:unnamed protein product, partial [Mesorhabditis spiculigera]